MHDWFSAIGAGCELSAAAERKLHDDGFVVIPGPVPSDQLSRLAAAYDIAVAAANSDDARSGSTTFRVTDFVNRGAEFDGLYIHKPLLQAAHRTLQRPFKLSTMLARTLKPHAEAQGLHVDYASGGKGWPMLGFIFMVDAFTSDNGATQFIPGSQGQPEPPSTAGAVLACGDAGSMIVFNGSVWHGHTTNATSAPRRSVQGAFIDRDDRAALDFSQRMRDDTLARIGPLATYVLAL